MELKILIISLLLKVYDLQGYGLGTSGDDAFVSFGSDETEGTEHSDTWFGNI